MAVFWVVQPCSLVEVYQHFRGPGCLHHQGTETMEAARAAETLVNFYQTTWRYNPEDSHLHISSRLNLSILYSRWKHLNALFLIEIKLVTLSLWSLLVYIYRQR
jgi:hypothetical protein